MNTPKEVFITFTQDPMGDPVDLDVAYHEHNAAEFRKFWKDLAPQDELHTRRYVLVEVLS